MVMSCTDQSFSPGLTMDGNTHATQALGGAVPVARFELSPP